VLSENLYLIRNLPKIRILKIFWKMDQNFCKIRQVKTFYNVLGDPQKTEIGILILHGWNQFGSQSWLPIAQDLSENGKKEILTVLPDMPCFGKSEDTDSVWGVLEYSNWLDEFYHQIQNQYSNIQNWFVLGHSFGGGVSALWASQFQPKIAGLILAAPAIVRRESTFKQKIITKITKITKKNLSLIPIPGLASLFQKIWYRLLGSDDYQKTSGVKRQIMQKILSQDLQFCLPNIQLKTLIISGTKDTYTPFTDSKVVASKIANSKLEIFENINHGLHLHSPDQLVQKVSQFVLQETSNH
jgi:pimeloyl-ACP methyl ester carboxylesterase